jgi:hypothetical protein
MGENLISVRINDINGKYTDVWGLTQDHNNFICIKKNDVIVDMISAKDKITAKKGYCILKRKIEKTKSSERSYYDYPSYDDNRNNSYHNKNGYSNNKNFKNNNKSRNNNSGYNKKKGNRSNERKGYGFY